jgi:hypothetical protein
MPYARIGRNSSGDGGDMVVRDRSGHEAAKQKAHDLLMSILPPEERNRLEFQGFISARGRRYEYVILPHSQTELFRKGRRVGFACLQLTVPAPVYDRMLAEYLLIKHDERAYLRTANVARKPLGTLELSMGLIAAGVLSFLLARVTIQLMQLLN